MLRFLIAAGLIYGLAACAAPEPPTEPNSASLAEDGRAIAEAQCARCHAVGEYGESAAPTAPPFRSVLSRYRAEVLREELIQGIQVSHPMPEFQLNPLGVDALIAYLQSIQQPPTQ